MRDWIRYLRVLLLSTAAVLYALHFLHLSADFPWEMSWTDWSRYTDEGWYSDAAVRQHVLRHWYLAGDFNPAVALPIWPLLEAGVFAITGVSVVAARGLAVVVFGVTLVGVWLLIERCERLSRSGERPVSPGLAAPLAVLLLAASPFLYAFEREAILEPLLAALTVLALLVAARIEPLVDPLRADGLRRRPPVRVLWTQVGLGLLLAAMVLTKPTAVALLPAIGYMLWSRAGYPAGYPAGYRRGYRFQGLLRVGLLPAFVAAGVWLAYYGLLVRPHYLEDFRYLFAANDYTSFQTDPLSTVLYWTVANGQWMGAALYPLFFVAVAWLVLARPEAFRNPLVPALLLWVAGYMFFLGYHNNLQSRYYLLLAVPVTMLVAIALDAFRYPAEDGGAGPGYGPGARWRGAVAAVCALLIAVPDATEMLGFVLHPRYTYVRAAERIAGIIRADRGHSPLLLSVSGSDLSLMTGLPAINTEFSTLDLDQLIARYRPGWYVTWNETNDEDMKAIAPFYRLRRVEAIPAMEDPDRNVLILYRLDAAAYRLDAAGHRLDPVAAPPYAGSKP